MHSSLILTIALSAAVLALLAVMALIIVHRRKTEKTPPSRVAFVPIIITGVGILFILALLLAKQPCTTDNGPLLPKFPLISAQPKIELPFEQPPLRTCIERQQSEDNQGRYIIKKDVCLTGYDKADESIAAEVQALEKQFLDDIGMPEVQPLSQQFALDIRTEEFAFVRQPQIQSVKMTIYKSAGGAHPNLEFRTWTFDRLTDRMVDFELLFQEEHNPLWTLYPLVKQQLMSEPYADERMIDLGTGDENFDNYRNFTIEGDRLVFYFEPGQVAPQAAGMQHVVIALADIQVILRPPFLDVQQLYDDDLAVPGNIVTMEELEEGCQDGGGSWLAEYDECEYASCTWCDELGATFLECESACRHDPDAQICTMQCVPVCIFE